jgi:hypothetical protein
VSCPNRDGSANYYDGAHDHDEGDAPWIFFFFLGSVFSSLLESSVSESAETDVGEDEALSSGAENRDGYARDGFALWRQVVPCVVSHADSTGQERNDA